MKLSFVVFLMVFVSIPFVLAQNKITDVYSNEQFPFSIENGKRKLTGTLTIPLHYNQKIPFVVFVSPPQPCNRDYYGLFSYMADILGHSGIASLRYDNRSFVDSTILFNDEDQYTMFDNAADVRDAIYELRKDKRFEHSAIGIIGHSEGGASAAIETSQNKDVSFLIVMSTIGIPGVDLAFSQKITNNFLYSLLSTNIRNEIVRSTYSIIQKVGKELDNTRLRMLITDDYKANYMATPEDQRAKMYGKQTLQQGIDNCLNQWMKPRLLEYIRFTPATYYSKISCPILVTYGKMDETVDWRANTEDLEKIFINSSKKNYTLLIVDSLNHNYETARVSQIKPMFDYSNKRTENIKDARFKEVCNIMSKWIYAQQPTTKE